MNEEQVTTFAEQHRAPDHYLYLLVDDLGECDDENPISVTSLTQSQGEDAVARVLRPDLSHTPSACPALIQLSAPGETVPQQQLKHSASYAMADAAYNKRYICGWLLSAQPLDSIAAHIAAQCNTTAASDGHTSPWFEPLRLELLAAALGGQLGDILNPIHAWLCPTSCGSYTLLYGRSGTQAAELTPLARQTQQLAPIVNEFLGVWRHVLQRPLDFAPWRWTGTSILPPQAGTHAFRLVRDAHRLGLSHYRDIISLSLHRVLIHPLLTQHPEIKHAIAQAAADVCRLEDHFNTYPDSAWKRIAADLPSAENYT